MTRYILLKTSVTHAYKHSVNVNYNTTYVYADNDVVILQLRVL